MPVESPQTLSVESHDETNTIEPIEENVLENAADSSVEEHSIKESIPDVVGEYPTEEYEEDLIDYNDKEAKSRWKASNRNDTIKHQEKLHSLGLIDQLPWEK
jgi:HEPN domain-containing protein